MSSVSPDQLSSPAALTPAVRTPSGSPTLVIAGFATVIACIFFFSRTIAIENAGRSFVLVPAAVGVSLILAGVTLGSAWQRAAIWFSVAMVGQTLSLQLINAGF